MSGGSYNYLCYRDSNELLTGNHDDELERMLKKLSTLSYTAQPANATGRFIEQLKMVRLTIQGLNCQVRRLAGVWKAVEWWDSGDCCEEDVKRAIKEFEGEDQHA